MRNIFSIILVIAAIAVFAIFTNPRFTAIRELRAQADSYDAALEKSKELVSIRDALNSTYSSIPTETLKRLDTFLPNSIDTVRLIIDVNTLAQKYGMSLGTITLGTAADSSTQTIGPSTSEYGTLTLGFSVTSSYDRFRAFLGDLERSLRLIDVSSVTFQPPSESTGLTTYQITLSTYWLK